MTLKLIRYTVYALAIVVVGLWVNRVRNIYNGTESSITTELPAKETAKTIPFIVNVPASTPAPKSSGQSVNLQPLIPTFISNALTPKKDYPVITLGKSNTIIFRDIVTPKSVGLLEQQLISMSQTLPVSTPIYLVMETPGGDIEAGSQLIDAAKALPQEIKTITLFSASMGFHIVESLGERLITPSGTLMSHRAAIDGLAGHVPGEAVVRLNKILSDVNGMDKNVAKRVGMKFEDYQALVRDEYWVSGNDAVKDHMADRTVLIACAKDLDDTYQQDIPTLFGLINVTWSTCPVINAPLGTNAGAILNKITKAEDKQALFNFLNDFFNNKEEFIKNYMINQSYKRFIY